MAPLVSVIIPVYNAEKFIAEAIKSVLEQDFSDWELLVVNDGSTDRTPEIVKELMEKDERIRLIEQENKGKANALNSGLALVEGKYISFLDADDIYCKDKLTKQVEFLEQHPEVDMVYADVVCEGERKNSPEETGFREKMIEAAEKMRKEGIKIKWSSEILSENRFIPACSVLIKREVFSNLQFDERLRNSEDYDLWYQIIGAGYRLKRLDIVAYTYRRHPNQKSNVRERIYRATEFICKKLLAGDYFKKVSE